MAATPSRRLGLHGPSGGDVADIPGDVVRLRDQLDEQAFVYDQGPLASRPAAGVEGRQYYSTTDGALYYDTGLTWVPFAWQPGDVRWSGAEPPLGWLACDGQTVSRRDFAALFAAIGTSHGRGDGSTTFAVPDARGRTFIHPDPAGLRVGENGQAVGQWGGAWRHVLAESEMPSHSHTVPSFTSSGRAAGELFTHTGTAAFATFNTGPAGGGRPHNNMPPYLVLNALVKY